MKLIFRVMVGVVILGITATYMISSGKWQDSVLDPISYALGQDAADAVDENVRDGLKAGDQFIADAQNASVTDLIDQLGTIELPSAERHPKYERELFGDGWQFNTADGCSTRETVLIRDLENVVMRDDRKCKVLSGVLVDDPYSGKTINFNSVENPMTVQIDHIVPLSVAWQMGAWEWDSNTRVQFANDLDNLLAADGPTNGSKGDRTPERWMPKNEAFHCEYAASYTAITSKYNLAMDQPVREKLAAVLEQC